MDVVRFCEWQEPDLTNFVDLIQTRFSERVRFIGNGISAGEMREFISRLGSFADHDGINPNAFTRRTRDERVETLPVSALVLQYQGRFA